VKHFTQDPIFTGVWMICTRLLTPPAPGLSRKMSPFGAAFLELLAAIARACNRARRVGIASMELLCHGFC
jgi:hypothetical protein